MGDEKGNVNKERKGIEMIDIGVSTRSPEIPVWAEKVTQEIYEDVAGNMNQSRKPENEYEHFQQESYVTLDTPYKVDKRGYGSFGGNTYGVDMEQNDLPLNIDTDDKKPYKSEQEMIEEVFKNNKANEIKYEDLKMGKQIGNGQFGAVYKAKWEGNVVV